MDVVVQQNAGVETKLTLGLSPAGSNGFDKGLDQLAPPAGPAGTLDARVVGDLQDYMVDLRAGQSRTQIFEIDLSPVNQDILVLSWDRSGLYNLGTFILTDRVTGDRFVLDMTRQSHVKIDEGSILRNGIRIIITPQYHIFMPTLNKP